MIILALYHPPTQDKEWIRDALDVVENLNRGQQEHKILAISIAETGAATTRLECIYPRFPFEYEEKEAEGLAEIIVRLEERLHL